MVIKWVLGVFAFTVGLQNVAESAGICGKAAIRRHWSDCRKFVECGEETTVVFQCPERSFFNPVTLVCDFAMYHECLVENDANIEYFGSRNFMEAKPGQLVMNSRCNELRLGAKFVNPDDCSQFFHCSPSGPMLFQCPASLLFNSRLNVCDWPQNVEDCSGPGPGPGPSPDGCQGYCIPDLRCPNNCIFDNIFLPHPGACSSYFACENGCACLRQCQNGFFWSHRLQRCVPTYESECENPVPLPCPVCVRDDRCPLEDDPDNPVQLPLPDRCDGFLKCHQGYACVIDCPVGMNFNQITGQCEIGECVTTPTIETTEQEQETTTPEPVTTTPEPVTTTPEPVATTPEPVTTTTPKPITTTPAPITTPTPTTPTDCPVCPPGVCTPDDRCPVGPCLECDPILLPHPEHCDRFLKCTHGFACEMWCPGGLHWNSAANRCDWPFLGDCATGPSSTGLPPADCPLDYRCPAFDNPWDPTLLPHPGDCTKFIKCENKRGCVRSCPEGLHWSIAHNRCEWPNVARCDPTIPIEPECPICPCTPCRRRGDRHPCVDNSACKRNVLSSLSLPYEQDYTRFYECLGGKACLLDCPRGTRFNRSRQRCEDV